MLIAEKILEKDFQGKATKEAYYKCDCCEQFKTYYIQNRKRLKDKLHLIKEGLKGKIL